MEGEGVVVVVWGRRQAGRQLLRCFECCGVWAAWEGLCRLRYNLAAAWIGGGGAWIWTRRRGEISCRVVVRGVPAPSMEKCGMMFAPPSSGRAVKSQVPEHYLQNMDCLGLQQLEHLEKELEQAKQKVTVQLTPKFPAFWLGALIQSMVPVSCGDELNLKLDD